MFKKKNKAESLPAGITGMSVPELEKTPNKKSKVSKKKKESLPLPSTPLRVILSECIRLWATFICTPAFRTATKCQKPLPQSTEAMAMTFLQLPTTTDITHR